MQSEDLNMVIHSGTTHIKKIFTFSPGNGISLVMHAAALRCHATHSHFALFMINNGLYKRSEKRNPEESDLENEGAREWVPLFLPNDQETPCPGRHEYDGRCEVMHHLIGTLFP